MKTVVEPNSKSSLRELYSYRQLLFFFSWREFKVRYKQTLLGFLWVFLQPLLFAGIVSIIVVRGAGLIFEYDQPAILVLLIGFIFWGFFEASFAKTANAIQANLNILKKVYFPKMILPLSEIISRFSDFFISFICFLGISLVLSAQLYWQGFLAVALGLAIISMFALGLGLCFASINMRYRDVRFLQPFIARLMFFASPVFYPFSRIDPELQEILIYLPTVSTIQFARDSFFNPTVADPASLLRGFLTSSVILAVGYFVFSRREARMVDF